ncbi:MAG: gamma-glutamyltransferase, partial [Cyanobacteria bacterium J06659_2]
MLALLSWVSFVGIHTILPVWAQSPAPSEQIAPESGTGYQAQPLTRADSFMVAAANLYAVDAGYKILRAGGSAIDAAIATQIVLNLVEPQSSGIGGGAFLLYFDAAAAELTAYDGRETAPQLATSDLFLEANGQPLDFFDAVVGGRSVGVPGVVKLLETVHQHHGNLAWAELFEPAIQLAEDGFIVSPRLATLIALDQDRLRRYPTTQAYFFHADGEPLQAGDRLQNPELAQTLRLIAEQGSAGFYQGAVAADLVAAVQGVSDNPGLLSLDDLANYEAKVRDPVCIPYRRYQVCGMGPPSSGGLTIGQILGMLNHFDLATLGST